LFLECVALWRFISSSKSLQPLQRNHKDRKPGRDAWLRELIGGVVKAGRRRTTQPLTEALILLRPMLGMERSHFGHGYPRRGGFEGKARDRAAAIVFDRDGGMFGIPVSMADLEPSAMRFFWREARI
jgi:hypothetical protein